MFEVTLPNGRTLKGSFYEQGLKASLGLIVVLFPTIVYIFLRGVNQGEYIEQHIPHLADWLRDKVDTWKVSYDLVFLVIAPSLTAVFLLKRFDEARQIYVDYAAIATYILLWTSAAVGLTAWIFLPETRPYSPWMATIYPLFVFCAMGVYTLFSNWIFKKI